MLKKLFKNKKGAALVEYALLIAGVALIAAGAVSIFGHKTTDLIATVSDVLPGSHTDDNEPIVSGKIIEIKSGSSAGPGGTSSGIAVDFALIASSRDQARLGDNVAGTGNANAVSGLVLEAR